MTTQTIDFIYTDGRESRQMSHITIANNGVLMAMAAARGPVKKGLAPLVNNAECIRLGFNPLDVMANQSPIECLVKLGENPGLVTSIVVPESKAQSLARIAANIEEDHDKATAAAWLRYKSSECADRAEDTFATAILRSAGY
jgi:hypothetical protein